MEIEELLSYYVADHEVYNSSCRDSSKYKGSRGKKCKKVEREEEGGK